MSFLQIQGLHKQFGRTAVLNGVDLSLEEGGFLVLVGPSGCGKSTLLNIVAGLEEASAGDILIAGERVNELPAALRDIAMVFQSYALYPNMNVGKNISFGLEMRGVGKVARNAEVTRVAKILQIEHLLKRRPSQLSGGQRQRVAMGRALVRKPRVFLFDEPLSNLDAKLRVDMRAEIKQLHQTLGTTIVYVTHDQVEAMTLATRIAVLKDGVLQQVGTPDEIYQQPANLFVADFMGSPAMNRVTGQLRSENGRVHFESEQLTVLCRDATPGLQQYDNTNVVMGIRAEDIYLADAATEQTIERLVSMVEPTGADTFVSTAAVDSAESPLLMARLKAGVAVVPQQKLSLSLDMRKAHFFDPDSGQRIA